jgi:hypothetical protein
MGLMKKTKKSRASNEKYDPSEWDDSASVSVVPEQRKVLGISTSIRLPPAMLSKLKRVAARKGDVGYQTLLKIWIAERLEKESA